MALTSFLGLVTLQVGTAMLAAAYWLIATLVVAVNLFDGAKKGAPDDWFSVAFVVLFALVTLVIGFTLFYGAYTESRQGCILAVVLVLALLIYWLVLSCFSLINHVKFVKQVCYNGRCPESFWMAHLDFRKTNQTVVRHHTSGENPFEQLPSEARPGEKVRKEHLAEQKRFKAHRQSSEEKYSTRLIGLEEDDYAQTTEAVLGKLVGEDYEDEHLEHSNRFENFLSHRQISENTIKERYNKTHPSFFVPVTKSVASQSNNDHFLHDAVEEIGQEDEVDDYESGEVYQFKVGIGLFGAIFFIIVNFLFFAFTIVIAWAFAQEIKKNLFIYRKSSLDADD